MAEKVRKNKGFSNTHFFPKRVKIRVKSLFLASENPVIVEITGLYIVPKAGLEPARF